jgi:spore germination protein GerM
MTFRPSLPKSRRSWIVAGALALAAALGTWLLFVALPRWYEQPGAAASVAPAAAPTEVRKIKATLYYVAEDGLRLVGVERDVVYGEGTVEQARRILEEQVKTPAEPLVSAIPTGTHVRSVYVTDRGDAFVDLSNEVSRGHTGGSLDEAFTVYTIVNALTGNLPAIKAVQILIDGREADTLAGHIDLRQPLQKNLQWVAEPAPAPVPTAGT